VRRIAQLLTEHDRAALRRRLSWLAEVVDRDIRTAHTVSASRTRWPIADEQPTAPKVRASGPDLMVQRGHRFVDRLGFRVICSDSLG
jgi:hypothetical protein